MPIILDECPIKKCQGELVEHVHEDIYRCINCGSLFSVFNLTILEFLDRDPITGHKIIGHAGYSIKNAYYTKAWRAAHK